MRRTNRLSEFVDLGTFLALPSEENAEILGATFLTREFGVRFGLLNNLVPDRYSSFAAFTFRNFVPVYMPACTSHNPDNLLQASIEFDKFGEWNSSSSDNQSVNGEDGGQVIERVLWRDENRRQIVKGTCYVIILADRTLVTNVNMFAPMQSHVPKSATRNSTELLR